MKNTLKFTLSSVLISAFVFCGQIGLVKEDQSSTVKLSLSKISELNQDVKGMQFDLVYNTDEVKLVDANTLLTGFTFEYMNKDNGSVRGVIFSLEGKALIPEELSNIIEFNFEAVEGFVGTSNMQLENVIVAGEHGEDITSQFSFTSFQADFSEILPLQTSLSTNYPNPFNPTTTIDYAISSPGFVSLVIYDINGAEVRSLVSENMSSGNYSILWNGINNSGKAVASGRYLMRMSTANFTNTITMTLLK